MRTATWEHVDTHVRATLAEASAAHRVVGVSVCSPAHSLVRDWVGGEGKGIHGNKDFKAPPHWSSQATFCSASVLAATTWCRPALGRLIRRSERPWTKRGLASLGSRVRRETEAMQSPWVAERG